MKRLFSIILAIVMLFSICSCESTGESTTKAGTQAENTAKEEPPVAYPFEDGEGRVRYQFYINGDLVETDHAPYTYPDEPKGAYYPLIDVLEYFGIECLFDETAGTLATKVNGQTLTAYSGDQDIVVGKVTMSGSAPEYVEDCFFVPSYVFMQLLDGVVDFTEDGAGVTLTTDIIINTETSGIEGLTLSAESYTGDQLYSGSEACPTCHGSGVLFCASCGAQGRTVSWGMKYDPVTGTQTPTQTYNNCGSCGATGHRSCYSCGGTGKN